MANVTVKAANSASDRRDFIELPYRLHKGHPYWVPPLRSDVAHLLDPANPFFAHAEAQQFVARDASGTVVGRIVAVKNDAHTERHHDGVGFFGFFECEKDPTVAAALFDAARDWLRARGFTTMRGPMSPSINDEIGFLIDGFDQTPVVMMPYTPQYYPGLAESYGFAKAKDVYAYRHDKRALELDRVKRLADVLAKRHGIVVRPLNMKNFQGDVDKVKDLYNAAWEANWGAVQITEAELADVAKQLKPVVLPDLVQFAEVNGQTVGFALALPDLNVALKHMGGRLFPFGFLQLLWYQRNIPGLRVWALGVHPDHRRSGVSELLYLAIIKNGLARGMVYGESGWILEDNFLMRQAIEKMGGQRYKTYRVYDKSIGELAIPAPKRFALVTGASGFVGGHLTEALLADGWRVRCLVRRSSNTRWVPADRVEVCYGDVGTPSSLPDAVRGVDTVFHLAAVTSARDRAEYARVNAGGTQGVIEAMKAAAPDATLVLCSSQSAAGPSREGRPITEADTPLPIGPYGESKLTAEQMVIASDLRHIIIRPPTVYGPRDVDILFAFRLASAGIAVRISSRGQKLSMVHVRDLAAGLVAAASADHARGVYYVSGGTHAWEEIVRGIGVAVGRRARVIVLPRPLVVATAWANRLVARVIHAKPLLTPERVLDMIQPDWSCDDSRARRELGYSSTIPLDEGLAETAAWYRQAGWL